MPHPSMRAGDMRLLAGLVTAGAMALVAARLWLMPTQRRPAGPAPVEVTGTIMLDGKAMPDGIVAFDGRDGTAAVITDVVNGGFALAIPPGEKVVIVDRYRAGASKDEMGNSVTESTLPIRYNAASTLRVIVKADGPNEFRLDLRSK